MKIFLNLLLTVILAIMLSASQTQAQVNETEPNDTIGAANPVDITSGNVVIAGAITPVGDFDKFRITIPTGRFIYFETFDATGNGCEVGFDTYIRLYNANGDEIAQDDDAGIGNCSKLGSSLVAGTYFIHVEDYLNNGTISGYRLNIRVVPMVAETEPNNTFAEAIASPVQISASVDIMGDPNMGSGTDIYRLTLARPTLIRIGYYDVNGGCPPNQSSMRAFTLFDSLFASRATFISPCVLWETRLPPNTYYLQQVGDWTFPSDRIRIIIEDADYVTEFESNNTFSAANQSPIQISDDITIGAAISPIGDVDRFRINLTSGSNLKLETTTVLGQPVCLETDTVLRLYNAGGTEIVSDDDGGTDACSLIDNVNLPAGIYYAHVEDFGNNTSIPLYFLAATITPDLISRPASFDFDGDRRTDVSIFRPGGGEWWYLRSSDGGNRAFQFGSGSDVMVPADYTGDGQTDVAFWRPSNGFWYVLRSEDSLFFAFPFGANGDVPAPADFDGDGKSDFAIFRPSSATWFINYSGGGTSIFNFGSPGDAPVVADYDGDGKADAGIYRAVVGEWWYRRSSDSGVAAFQFGLPTDRPLPADYTGDGRSDIAFWRPSNGMWYILRSEDSTFYAFPFGSAEDLPAPGDYDGDGVTDAAVFRPSTATWFILSSQSGVQIVSFGANGDKPVPGAFVR